MAGPLARSDVVVGTGLAIMEGMAAGNAAIVLGRQYGGIVTPEFVAAAADGPDFSGQPGPLTREPTAEAIAADLDHLRNDPERLRQLQRWSEAYARRYLSLDAMTAAVVAEYQSAVARRGPSQGDASTSGMPPRNL